MSPPCQKPAPPLTTAQIDAWIHTATLKRLDLHLYATEPSSNARAQAFWEMGELCQDAIEAVRVLSAQLWDASQAARGRSADIVVAPAQFLA